MPQLRPTEADLKRLKTPLGVLLHGNPKQTIPKLALIIRDEKPPHITAVGDIVARETAAARLPVNLRIIDNKTMRQFLESSNRQKSAPSYRVSNPAGVITTGSWETIKKAIKEKGSIILVDGEEDLLALPCILESPDRALVLYGQPSEGMVVVTVEPGIKKEVKAMLDRASKEDEDSSLIERGRSQP